MPEDRPNVLFFLNDEHSFRGFGHLDADSPLYRPHVLAEEPDVVFDDVPAEGNGG